MAQQWKVTTEQLKSGAQKLTEEINSYNTEWKRLYTESDTLTGQGWQGEASSAFRQKLESYKNDFEQLETVLKNFVEFLNSAAQKYETTENAIKDAASQLSSGI